MSKEQEMKGITVMFIVAKDAQLNVPVGTSTRNEGSLLSVCSHSTVPSSPDAIKRNVTCNMPSKHPLTMMTNASNVYQIVYLGVIVGRRNH